MKQNGRNQRILSTMSLAQFLQSSRYIDIDHPSVQETAQGLRLGTQTPLDVARACFEFVRDEVRHSWDHKQNPVTCRASDVLRHRTGYCYAKSHLLAALLRANGIPAGLCYQRLSVGESGAPYCLHGLNAVYLDNFGWYRLDARGNKPGVDARFCPPVEALAFAIRSEQERDLPEIWAEPLPQVITALENAENIDQVAANLPDIVLWGGK
jgi:transglutaminase-like putative cysteine protease